MNLYPNKILTDGVTFKVIGFQYAVDNAIKIQYKNDPLLEDTDVIA